MKKEYETPKAEKLEFDYSEVVTASGSSGMCFIAGMSVSWADTGDRCSNSAAGDE